MRNCTPKELRNVPLFFTFKVLIWNLLRSIIFNDLKDLYVYYRYYQYKFVRKCGNKNNNWLKLQIFERVVLNKIIRKALFPITGFSSCSQDFGNILGLNEIGDQTGFLLTPGFITVFFSDSGWEKEGHVWMIHAHQESSVGHLQG